MLGCFERALYPRVSRAAKRLAPELAAPAARGAAARCTPTTASSSAARDWPRRSASGCRARSSPPSGGCAAHLASVLGPERVQASSRSGSSSASDAEPSDGSRRTRPPTHAAHRPPGLLPPAQRAGVHREPRALSRGLGEYVELPSAGACCGAAGTYALMRPEDSARVLDRHLDEIAEADLDAIVVVNPGCYRQLAAGRQAPRARTRVVHLAELLAEAK